MSEEVPWTSSAVRPFPFLFLEGVILAETKDSRPLGLKGTIFVRTLRDQALRSSKINREEEGTSANRFESRIRV